MQLLLEFQTLYSWNFAIKYAIPVILTVIILMQLIQEFKAPYENYPIWAIWLGWTVAIAPIIISLLIPQRNDQKTDYGKINFLTKK